MTFLDKLGIKEKPRNPSEVVFKLVSALNVLHQPERERDRQLEKALEQTSKYLSQLKALLFGDEEHEVTKEAVLQVATEICNTDLLYLLVNHLGELDFETRKDAASVFSAAVRVREHDDKPSPGANYIRRQTQILSMLFQGYDEPNIALNCGSMLRDCLRDQGLTTMVMEGPLLFKFFDKVDVANFEIASDAFSSFKDLLTRHKPIVAQYLSDHYSEFFPEYMKLLRSTNYVTRRQSIKLLGELLLDRTNVKVMVRFVSEVQHLMQMMNLLKDQSRSIQFEAFHVFKVFVANPNKPQPIIDILLNNKEKLLKYLEEFHTERDEDEQFKEEKAVIIKEISTLGSSQQPQQLQQQPAQGSAATAPAPAESSPV